jgi:chromate transport protein ChrA
VTPVAYRLPVTRRHTLRELLVVFGTLGVIGFGGPAARWRGYF